MAGFIPEHIIAQIQAATDIVGVIEQYVPLKKAGRNLVGLCPFHKEKTPSFSVSPENQFFHCFGCKQGGSVFQFLMLHERMEFPEAVRYLADQCGVQVPEARGIDPKVQAAQKSEREQLLAALERSATFYTSQLTTELGIPAKQYLRQRGISESTIELWQLGFAPNSWDSLSRFLQNQGVSADLMEKAGLASKTAEGNRHYDRFRGRVMFPIRDVRDRAIGFGARMLGEGEGPKYLNSPETVLFNKSACLYGLNKAKSAITERRTAVVVEGYTDVLMAHQFGVPYVVATLGTALTREHIQLLRRYAQRVVLVFDADAAGEKASDRSIELFLEEDLDVSVATLDSGLDPCDFLLQHGPQLFEQRVESAREILDFKIQQAQSKYNFQRMDEKSRAVSEILTLLPKIANEVKRSLFLQAVAARLSVPESALRAQSARILSRAQRPGGARANEVEATPGSTAAQIAQKDVITHLLKYPDRSDSLFHQISPDEFPDEGYRTIYQVAQDVFEAEGAVDAGVILSTLESRWPGQEVGKFVATVLAEEPNDDFLERFQGSLQWFAKARKRKEFTDLKEQLLNAQSQGNADLEVQLLKEAQDHFSAPQQPSPI